MKIFQKLLISLKLYSNYSYLFRIKIFCTKKELEIINISSSLHHSFI